MELVSLSIWTASYIGNVSIEVDSGDEVGGRDVRRVRREGRSQGLAVSGGRLLIFLSPHDLKYSSPSDWKSTGLSGGGTGAPNQKSHGHLCLKRCLGTVEVPMFSGDVPPILNGPTYESMEHRSHPLGMG